MDRFIVDTDYLESKGFKILKSNMDRFIALDELLPTLW